MRRLLVLVSVVGCALGVASAAPAVAATKHHALAPAAVRSLAQAGAGSTTVVLRWANPKGARFAGVEIRGTNRPGVLPATQHSNGHIVRLTAKHRTYTVRHLTAGKRYGFSVFATDGHGHYSKRASVFATTAPAPGSAPHVYDLGSSMRITWLNSHTKTFRRVVARYAKGSAAPGTPTAGHAVGLASARATSASLHGLASNTTYSVGVFAEDSAHRASTPAVARFTTDPTPDGDGTVTGRVVDQAGDPLIGAVVTPAVDFDPDPTPAVTATTGADGRYTLRLPPGETELDAGGNDIAGGSSDASGYQPGYTDATVRPGAVVTAGDVVLSTGAAITVRVTDSAGKPIAGAAVYGTPVNTYVDTDAGGGLFFGVADGLDNSPATGPDGTVTVRGLDATDPLRVCATVPAGGYLGTCAYKPSVLSGGTVVTSPDLALAAGDGGSLAGRIRGGGHGLPGVEVDVESTDEDSDAFGTALTAADGTFEVHGLAPGRYTVCAESYTASGTGYLSACGKKASVATGSATDVGDLTEPVAAAVSGTVTGPGGHRVPDAEVVVEAVHPTDDDPDDLEPATTDRFGHYRINGLSDVAVRVCVMPDNSPVSGAPTGVAPGCVGHGAAVTPHPGYDRAGLDAALTVGSAVSGTVRNARGTSVAGELIAVTQITSGDDGEFDLAVTDGRGRYAIAGLPAGRYDVCDQGSAGAASSFVGVQFGDCDGLRVTTRVGATAHADLTIAAVDGIAVTVHDADGAPVAAVNAAALTACSENDEDDDCDSVSLFNPKADVAVDASAMTHADGTATLGGLPAGRYAVCLFGAFATTASGGSPTGYADSCSGSTFTVTVKAGQTTPLAVTLAAGGSVTGRITDTGGRPIAGVQVSASNSASTDYPGAGDEFGFGSSGDADSPMPGQDEVSGPDGSYTVLGVRPGAQTVCADADGVGAGGGYLDQCFGGVPGGTTGTRVTVTGSGVSGRVDITLAAGAGLRGSVRLPGNKATSEAEVIVFSGRSLRDEVADTQPADSGDWAVTQLPAGSYTVCVLPEDDRTNGSCWKQVVWPVAADDPPLAKATLIPLSGGQVKSGIDVTLTR